MDGKVLYSFGAFDADGNAPKAGLTIDSVGNLYGTTLLGGSAGSGTVFELTRQGDGNWSKSIIHSFGSTQVDGQNPTANLTLDRDGNLFSTTINDGDNGQGTVFELSPKEVGTYTEKVFSLNIVHGDYISSGLFIDPSGNLYGTTHGGGGSDGTVFKLTPQTYGTRQTTILHAFAATGEDGKNPYAGLVLDSHGNLYGITTAGGAYGDGTVFEIENAVSGGPAVTTVSDPFPSTSIPLVAGEPITLQVTITPTGLAVPTGTVTFADPAGGSVTVPVIAGTATYYGKVPPVGTYSVYASYSGGSGFLPSQSAVITRTVTPPPPQ